MADVLTVIAKVRAPKGKGDALAALLKEQVAAVRKAGAGLPGVPPHRSTKDPDLFIFYEQYKDDRRVRSPPQGSAPRGVPRAREKEGLVAGPPEVEIYRSLTE